jgi:hypothetical protein
MKMFFRVVPILAGASSLLVTACSHKGGGLSAKEEAAFDQAASDVKQMWTKASEAAKANDYVTAYNLYYSLLNAELTPAQKQVVSKANGVLNERLLAAMEKGDPEAQKAMEELRSHSPARQIHE